MLKVGTLYIHYVQVDTMTTLVISRIMNYTSLAKTWREVTL